MASSVKRGIAALVLVFGAFLVSGGARAAAFTPGSIVVYRIGDGTVALTAAAAPVFLDEYSPAGMLKQTIPLPTVTSGANRRITGAGNAANEGMITRSADGQYLVVGGYDAAPATATIATTAPGTNNRVVARVAADGTVDTSTALSNAAVAGNIRGVATVDGSAFWTTSNSNSVSYSTLGAAAATQLSSVAPLNLRGVAIQGGQLYVSSMSGAFRLATVGSGVPTTAGQTITNLPGFPTATGAPNQFFFADLSAGVAGLDTVYVVDESAAPTGGIYKYSLVAGSWVANGSIVLATARGLTATVSGTSVTLYVTGAAGSSLQTLTDSSGYNATITGSLTSIVAAATNTAFRGVALAPVPSTFAFTMTHNGSGTGVTASIPPGTINCAGGSGTCSASYAAGSMVTFAATPDVGSNFTGWSGACSGTGTCTVTMDAAKNVAATFDLAANNLLTVTHAGAGGGTTASVPPGTINCLGGSGTCSASLASGSMITLAATPNGSSAFAGWSGDCSGTGTCTVTMSAARNVTANFDSSILTVTHNGSGSGTTASVPAGTINCTGSAGVCSAGYLPGSVVTLSATPSGAASFTGWSGACMGTGSCMVTMNSAKSVTATFDLGVTRIHTVQGSGAASPLVGQQILVQGIVTADFQGASKLNGFFIQEPDAFADADPTTSEGIFVFTNTLPAAISVGDLVQVVGTVSEFGTAPNTLTEIVTPTVNVLSSGNPLPALTIVNLPVASAGDMERYEGMRVQFNQTLTVSDNFDLGHFGEIGLSANGQQLQSTNVVDLNDNPATGTNSAGTGNLAAVLAYDDLNARSSFVLDDGLAGSFPSVVPFIDPVDHTLRLGSTLNSLTGIFSQSFGAYRVYATTTPVFNYAPRPLTPPVVGGNLKVASANVLNYFNGNGATGVFPTSRGADSLIEFNRQRAKVHAALTGLHADVIGLMEVQNNGNHATPAIQDILSGLNAIDGAGTWAAVPPPANYGPFGGSGLIPGGSDEIRPAIIYRTAVVAPVGVSTSPNDTAFNQARAPIAQSFKLLSNNEQFTLVVNHFKSKNSGGTGLDADQGDDQAFFNNARKLQAAALLNFIGTLTASGPTRVISMGDYNAYEQEDPIDVLRAGGLTTLVNDDHSFLFNGLSGSLDHALANAALLPLVTGAAHWHINADEPVFLDYNVENKNTAGCTSACTNPDYYTATPFRASDHDPVLVGLQFTAAQTISFGALAGKNFGDAPFAVSATSTSLLTVSFSSQTSGVCTVSGVTVTIVAAGTCTVRASQAGDTNFAAAADVDQSFTVATAAQTIGFGTLAGKIFGDAPFTVSATSTSSLTVTFSSQTTGVCTVLGNTVTIIAAGTCTVRASQAGNAGYAPAADVDQGFTVAQGTQMIAFAALPGKNAGDAPFTVSATATSSLAVSFSSLTTGVCTVSGNTVTILATGVCTIRASQAGNGNYAAAANVDQPFSVATGTQSISFGVLAGKVFGAAPFTVSATATSSLAVSFSSLTTAVCTVSGNTVTIVAAGTCTIRAAQGGDANFAPAANVDQPFTVAQATQTIGFGALAGKNFGDAAFAVSATATSSLPVSFSSLTTGVCTVSGNTVTIVAVGACTIRAAQAGNANYAAAANIDQPFTVAQGAQTIAFNAPADHVIGSGSFTISATGGASGNAVTFSSSTAPVCTATGANGATINLLTVGTCTLIANQAGNVSYSAAAPVSRSFNITAVATSPQTITFAALVDRALGSGSFTVSATGGGSGNPVTFGAAPASVCTSSGSNGSIINLIDAGTCTVTANQQGNASFSAAVSVAQSFTVIGGLPSAPAIACFAGVRSATCTFAAPSTNGGPAISSFTLTCTPANGGGHDVSGPASPLTLTGLPSGVQVKCSATASNTVGTGPASNVVIVEPFAKTAVTGGVDPGGNGKGMVLIRDLTANNGGQLLLGGFDDATKKLVFAPAFDPGAGQRVLGAGDFGGSHKSDLLLQDPVTGMVQFWSGFDGGADSRREVRAVKPGWVVETVADIDGDGKSDIVWRYVGSPLNPPANQDDVGVIFVWFMNGGAISEIKARGGAPLTWTLVGSADLSGSGMANLIWLSPAGQIRSLSPLSGRNFVNQLVGAVPTGYTLTRLGDFTGDGKGDCLFRNAQGKLKLWTMDGTTIASQIELPDSDPSWQLFATADLNGDGTTDLIFKRPDNTLVVWLMNAATPAAPTVIDNAGTVPTNAVNIDP